MKRILYILVLISALPRCLKNPRSIAWDRGCSRLSFWWHVARQHGTHLLFFSINHSAESSSFNDVSFCRACAGDWFEALSSPDFQPLFLLLSICFYPSVSPPGSVLFAALCVYDTILMSSLSVCGTTRFLSSARLYEGVMSSRLTVISTMIYESRRGCLPLYVQ